MWTSPYRVSCFKTITGVFCSTIIAIATPLFNLELTHLVHAGPIAGLPDIREHLEGLPDESVVPEVGVHLALGEGHLVGSLEVGQGLGVTIVVLGGKGASAEFLETHLVVDRQSEAVEVALPEQGFPVQQRRVPVK